MVKCIVKKSPYYIVGYDGKTYCLRDGRSLLCNVSGPMDGVIEFSIEKLHDLEWYESSQFDEVEFDKELSESLSMLVSTYMLEDDAKLSPKALELKRTLLDLFEESIGDGI